jgi:PKD repeat protein
MIQFYGNASGGLPPYSWYWDFGDGTFSNKKNPLHIYTKANNYTITLTVTDSNGTSIVDNVTVKINHLNVNFIKPEKALYIHNKKITSFLMPLIIGPIDIEVDTLSIISSVKKVEFYINNALKSSDTTAPYCWRWEERSLFKYTIELIVVDDLGNSKNYELVVWKFL